MPYEYAAYFKLLLLCGYKDELQQYIDNSLIEQNPISDIILSLLATCNDEKKMLSVLNEYLLQSQNTDFDYDKTVFDLVMSFLKKKYHDNSISMKEITQLMYRLALHTERYLDEPWQTMYFIGDLFCEAEAGYIDKEDYQQKFEAFIDNRILYCDYSS